MEPAYKCKLCGIAVLVREGKPHLWGCSHAGGTIVASMDAVVSQDGSFSGGRSSPAVAADDDGET